MRIRSARVLAAITGCVVSEAVCVLVAPALAAAAVLPTGWTVQWEPRPGSDVRPFALEHVDKANVWALCDGGLLLHTTDAGITWTEQSTGETGVADVSFPDTSNGWVVGIDGLILRTEDGGATWKKQSSGTSNKLFSVDFVDAEHGCVFGAKGTILRTSDGGRTWRGGGKVTNVTVPANASLDDLELLDAKHGFAIGYDGSESDGMVAETTDGGATWRAVSWPENTWLYDLSFSPDGKAGCAVGDDGHVVGIVGGITHQHPSPDTRALEVVALSSATHVWAAGIEATYTSTPCLYQSTDSGASWTWQEGISIGDLTFADDTHGWALSEGRILGYVPGAGVFKPVQGPTRIGTAIQASRASFATATTVVVATAWNFPDALGGSSLAGALDAPLLLTDKDSLPQAVSDEIARLGAKDAVILGGVPAVGTAVETQLGTLLGGASHVKRVGGADRFETAALVASETVKTLAAKGRAYDGTVFVAVGDNFPDALAASPLAAAKGWPILLTRTPALPDASAGALTALGAKRAVMLGSETVVSADVAGQLTVKLGAANVSRLAGGNRYQTAVEIAKYGAANGMGYGKPAMATGENYPDALSGGVMAGRMGSVMLLTPQWYLHPDVAALISANKGAVTSVYFLGSTAALSLDVRDAVAALLK